VKRRIDYLPKTGQPFTFAIWIVKSGKEQAFISAWEGFARWTKANLPGTEEAYLLRDVDKPGRFITIGPWKDVESILAWRSRSEFKEFFRSMREIVDEVNPQTLSLMVKV
jgi:heme-degrading monooxygenase HmoA